MKVEIMDGTVFNKQLEQAMQLLDYLKKNSVTSPSTNKTVCEALEALYSAYEQLRLGKRLTPKEVIAHVLEQPDAPDSEEGIYWVALP